MPDPAAPDAQAARRLAGELLFEMLAPRHPYPGVPVTLFHTHTWEEVERRHVPGVIDVTTLSDLTAHDTEGTINLMRMINGYTAVTLRCSVCGDLSQRRLD